MSALLMGFLQSPHVKPPYFEDEERTRVAQYLHYILLITMIGMGGFVLTPPLLGNFDGWNVIICGGILLLSSLLLVFLRLGYVRLASYLFIGSALGGTIFGGFITTGIRTPGLIAVPLLLTICSLLLGNRATLITGLLCLLGLTILLVRGHPGASTMPPQLLDISYFSAALLVISVTVLILHFTINQVVQSQQQIQQQAQVLTKLNAELQREMSERARTEKLLYQEQKLESIGLLVGGIAHDFNNLFTGGLSQAMLAQQKLAPEHAAYRHLEKSIKATQRAAELTRQLLAYTGKSQVEHEAVDLNQLLQDNQALLDTTLAKHTALILDLQPHLPLLEAARGQMQQVLMNLLINAAQAIQHEAGRIRVTTRRLTLEHAPDAFKFVGPAPAAGEYIHLTVEDNGSGIPQAILDRIFDPYFTTKAQGHGLGLSAVLGIIQAHQGSLQVTSTPGQGSCFQIYLPLSQQTAQARPVRQPATTRTTVDALILVIEDQEEVRNAALEIFHHAGYRTLKAADGYEGIALFQQHQANIGLVLLDVLMPGLSGLETLEQLRSLDPAAKVILTSGYSEQTLFTQMQRQRPADFLPKPYFGDTLLNCVATVLQR